MKVDTPPKRTYRLTIQYPIEAADDAQARALAQLIANLARPLLSKEEVGLKLQELYANAPPRKVPYTLEK